MIWIIWYHDMNHMISWYDINNDDMISMKWYEEYDINDMTREKSLSKTSFHLRIDGAEKRLETRQRWKNARRLQDICESTQQMFGSLLAFFHPCLASILFSAPSSLKWNEILEKLFTSFCSFWGVFKATFQRDDERVCCAADEHFGTRRKNVFCASDERFSVLDERVESTHSNFSYTCCYQQFLSRTSLEIATHRHAPSKTGGRHVFILTCEYTTPTSYICNRVLCWTKRLSRWLCW